MGEQSGVLLHRLRGRVVCSVGAESGPDTMMMASPEKLKKKPPKDSLTLLPCFYFVELPIVASSMVSLYFLELTDLVQPAQVGFRCHDRDLSMPYVDGGDELIPLLMLLSLAFAGPAASIMLVEGLIYCLQLRLKLRRPEGSINAGGCNFNSFLRRTVRFVGVHVFGLCATALVTDIIQLATGYHAPFFLTVCKPNYTQTGVSCDLNPYITKDICSGHDQHAIMAARKTFPSQHATLSAFAAVYVSMYFNSTISDSTKLLKPVLVFAFAIAAALTGLTQITQHRSHPIDVYAGFLIGAFIAAYLALHAVANFQSSEDVIAPPPPPPPKEDPLRALTERGHDSVYNKGPASASESNDEIATNPAPLARLEGLSQLQRDKGSVENLKRASVDVELLAPRSPMGKETMLTFSNTLPRASMNANGVLGGGDAVEECVVQPVQPVQRRLKAVQVPLDPMRSQQLVSEWKQKSMEMRGFRDEAEREASEEGSEVGSVETDDGGSHMYQPRSASSSRTSTPPPGGAKAVPTPRPPHIPDAGPPPVSPKSALTRAKWMALREKAAGDSSRGSANQPRLMQVIAMSKQQGLLPSSPSDTGRSPETTSTCSGSSTHDSPHYKSVEKNREAPGIVTVDAHAPHHPVVQANAQAAAAQIPQAPPLAHPWQWSSDTRDTYDLNDSKRRDVTSQGSSFRPQQRAESPQQRAASPQQRSSSPTLAEAEAQRREMAMRRKTALVLLDRDVRNDGEHYYKSLQARRYRE
uniref:Phospholipid phosphatase-related protein type 3 n=1 Tax=Knipowitschia caucasica TaxID=637954 RepID=A0AAV2KP32_KNICA